MKQHIIKLIKTKIEGLKEAEKLYEQINENNELKPLEKERLNCFKNQINNMKWVLELIEKDEKIDEEIRKKLDEYYLPSPFIKKIRFLKLFYNRH